MIRYALHSLRFARSRNLAAFLALLLAAALVTASGSLLVTGLKGQIRTERYAAVPLIVAGDQNVHQTKIKQKHGKTKVKHKAKPLAERVWLPAGLTARIQAVPGVARTVPEMNFPAYPLLADGKFAQGQVLGHAWESAALTPFVLQSGQAPRDAQDVVINRDLALRNKIGVGERITVQSTGAPTSYRVSGIAQPPNGDLREQSSLFFSTAEAVRLSRRPGQVAAIGILPEKGTNSDQLMDAVKLALAGTTAQVHPASERGAVEFLDADRSRVQLISLGGALSGTSLLVGLLVVSGLLTLSVQQRTRELALLRAVAATPRQVRRLIGAETVLLALPAATLGAVLGLPLAVVLRRLLASRAVVPDTLALTLSPLPGLAAIAATVLGAWLAAVIAARRVARIRPSQALAESRVEPSAIALPRLVTGGAFLALGLALLIVLTLLHTEPASSPVLYLSVIVLSTAVALLGPQITRGALQLIGPVLKVSPVSGFLASSNTQAYARRFAGAVTPLTLLIGMTCTLLFAPATLARAGREQSRAGTLAPWTMTSAGPGIPGSAAEKARTLPGVDAVTEIVHSTVRVGLDQYPIQGVTPQGLDRTLDLDLKAGTLDRLGKGGLAVSETAERTIGGVGSHPVVTLGDGTRVALTVVAVYRRGLGFGDLTAAHDLVAAHMDNPLASAVLVRGVSRSILHRQFPGLTVQDRAQSEALRAGQARADAAVTMVALGLIIGFTAIAVANTLALITSGRGREFTLMRLIGATRQQVLDLLRLETLVLVLISAVVGTVIAVATLSAFAIGMTGGVSLYLPPLAYTAVIALAAALALGATMVSVRVTMGQDLDR
jgi:putative ABC transport system permease protein